jgi:Spy/CpxP family protein refolding chaperone
MKRFHRLVILSAVAILSGTALYATPPGPGPMGERPEGPPREPGADRQPMMRPPHPGLPDREQLKRAGATDAQIQTLAEFDYAQQQKQIDWRAKADKAELAVRYLMRAATVEEKAVMEVADALNQARGELFKLEVGSQFKVKQVLGDAVLQKLREMGPPLGMPCHQTPGKGPDDQRPPQMNAPRPPMSDWFRPGRERDEAPRPPADAPRPPPDRSAE